jgi:hypothetical protein
VTTFVNRLVVALALGLMLGMGAAAFAATARAPRPINIDDLRPTIKSITVGSLRKKEKKFVTDRDFRKKMGSALRSPLHLKQTFPHLLARLLKPLIGSGALPGKRSVVAFDAHIANTGLIKLGKNRLGRQRTIEAIVDSDDSGLGRAGVDALSIGTALVQAGFSKKTLREAAEAFAEAATGRSSSPAEVEGPDWGEMRKRWLGRNTRVEKRDGVKVPSFKGYDRATSASYDAIEKKAARDPVLRDYDVLDIAETGKPDGGSGGLSEYLVLARKKTNGKTQVYLLKEQKTPGAHELGGPQPRVTDRIKLFKKDLWTEEMPDDVFFYMQGVKIGGRSVDFLVRNQFSRMSAASDTGPDEDAIRAARIYGRAHAGDFGKLTAQQIADWMVPSSAAVAQALEEVHGKLHNASKGKD